MSQYIKPLRTTKSPIINAIDFEKRKLQFLNIREKTEWLLILLIPVGIIAALPTSIMVPVVALIIDATALLHLLLTSLLVVLTNLAHIRRISMLEIGNSSNYQDMRIWSILESILVGATSWFLLDFIETNLEVKGAFIVLFAILLSSLHYFNWVQHCRMLFLSSRAAKSLSAKEIEELYNFNDRGDLTESVETRNSRTLNIIIRALLIPSVFIACWLIFHTL